MTYQTQKFQSGKDPFPVQSLPKSFYHPSPSKEVDEREAIRSPQRRTEPRTRCAQEEEFLRGSLTYKTSAIPNIKTLGDTLGSRTGQMRGGELTGCSQFDESWRDSERPTSASYSGNNSKVTSATEGSSADTRNIADLVKGIESLRNQQISADAAGSKVQNTAGSSHTGESVLQRCIERFRNSAPRSREERMKEKGEKLQFWWLQSPPGSGAESVIVGDERARSLRHAQITAELRSEPQMARRLTREALLAMDEETAQLQNKADRLLSESEVSLASSSPVVSTEGLGTSTSVSDFSVREDQAPYKPAFVRVENSYHRLPTNQNQHFRKDTSSIDAVSKLPSDDILARWRLRRKMEEASAAPTFGHTYRAPNQKSQHHTLLDSRLEEFRKKILSQKALVTHEDIQYERQKMSMIMEDVSQSDGIVNKNQAAAENLEPLKDAVLERLHRITHGRSSEKALANEDITQPPAQKELLPSFVATPYHNFSINNANACGARGVRYSEHLLTTPALNKNNTASSDQHTSWNMNTNSVHEHSATIDSFQSQMVCDPKQRSFFLADSKTVLSSSGPVGVGIPVTAGVTGNNSQEQKKMEHEKPLPDRISAENSEVSDPVSQNGIGQVKKNTENISRGRSIKNVVDKIEAVKDSRGNDRIVNQMSNKNKGSVSECALQENENIYHQFLEAERPISETKRSKVRMENRVPSGDNKNQHFSNEEESARLRRAMIKHQKQADEKGAARDKKQTKEQDKRKHKSKTSAKNDRDQEHPDRSEVLSDITNESNHSMENFPERPSSLLSNHHRGDPGKILPQESGDVGLHPKVLSKKTRHGEDIPEPSLRKHLTNPASSSQRQQPVQHAIGQTVMDHLFESSVLESSVDSWASMFPQSPGLSHSLHGSGYSVLSRTPSQKGSTPSASTPVSRIAPNQDVNSEEHHSDGEFGDDPLLQILRQKRDHYLQRLEFIEKRLQKMET